MIVHKKSSLSIIAFMVMCTTSMSIFGAAAAVAVDDTTADADASSLLRGHRHFDDTCLSISK